MSLPQGMPISSAVIGEQMRFRTVAENCSAGTMRCSELRRAVHELRGILHRMQDPSTQEEEDSWKGQGLG